MKVELGHSDLVYDLPGEPYHPADVMIARMHHRNKMRRIRQMDINEWVEEQIE